MWNAKGLAIHIKFKHRIFPVIPMLDTASAIFTVDILLAVYAVESDNENIQLYSLLNSSSLNKTKRKNTDKYAHLLKKR